MLAAEDGVHDVAEPGELGAVLSSGLDFVGRAELVVLYQVEMEFPLARIWNVRRQHDKHFVGTIGYLFQCCGTSANHSVPER